MSKPPQLVGSSSVAFTSKGKKTSIYERDQNLRHQAGGHSGFFSPTQTEASASSTSSYYTAYSVPPDDEENPPPNSAAKTFNYKLMQRIIQGQDCPSTFLEIRHFPDTPQVSAARLPSRQLLNLSTQQIKTNKTQLDHLTHHIQANLKLIHTEYPAQYKQEGGVCSFAAWLNSISVAKWNYVFYDDLARKITNTKPVIAKIFNEYKIAEQYYHTQKRKRTINLKKYIPYLLKKIEQKETDYINDASNDISTANALSLFNLLYPQPIPDEHGINPVSIQGFHEIWASKQVDEHDQQLFNQICKAISGFDYHVNMLGQPDSGHTMHYENMNDLLLTYINQLEQSSNPSTKSKISAFLLRLCSTGVQIYRNCTFEENGEIFNSQHFTLLYYDLSFKKLGMVDSLCFDNEGEILTTLINPASTADSEKEKWEELQKYLKGEAKPEGCRAVDIKIEAPGF